MVDCFPCRGCVLRGIDDLARHHGAFDWFKSGHNGNSIVIAAALGAESILVEGSSSPLMALIFSSFSCRPETKGVLLKWPSLILNRGERLQA